MTPSAIILIAATVALASIIAYSLYAKPKLSAQANQEDIDQIKSSKWYAVFMSVAALFVGMSIGGTEITPEFINEISNSTVAVIAELLAVYQLVKSKV